MVVIALKEHELPSIPGDRAAAERGCRCGGRPPSVTARSPHAPGPPGTTGETIPSSSCAVLSSAVVHDHAHVRCLAEDVFEKDRQSAQRTDAGDSPGADVLDAAEHATRRLRANVELKDECSLGR